MSSKAQAAARSTRASKGWHESMPTGKTRRKTYVDGGHNMNESDGGKNDHQNPGVYVSDSKIVEVSGIDTYGELPTAPKM